MAELMHAPIFRSGLKAERLALQDEQNLYRGIVQLEVLCKHLTKPDLIESEFFERFEQLKDIARRLLNQVDQMDATARIFPGGAAFVLYDTYGFPLDLTELMGRERGLSVDVSGFERLMEQQRERARGSQKKQKIEADLRFTSELEARKISSTKFLGYDFLEAEAVVDARRDGSAEQLQPPVVAQAQLVEELLDVAQDDGRLIGADRLRRSTSRDRYAKTRRSFRSSRGDCGGSRAGTGRGGAHLSRCRSTPRDSGASYGDTFVALGAARSCVA